MDRGEVSALLSPSRRRSKIRAQRIGGDTGFDESSFKREEIAVEPQEEEAFLRSLDEQLQQRIERLAHVDLVLGAKQINYLAFRLHEALEPKRDSETNVIQAWTIQPQAQLKVKMSSHIQVLKLSTILREVQRLRIHQQSQLRSPIEIEIFPLLRAIEIVHTEVAALRNVHFFARQLRQFRLEHTPLMRLSQILSPQQQTPATTWKCLQSLRINCCSLPSVDACLNELVAIEVVDLAWNEIAQFEEPPKCTTLQWLDLCHNKLTSFPPLANLFALKVLDVSVNHIQSLQGVESLVALIDLDVSHNALSHIGEMELLTGLKQLRRLVIRENPIARRPDYRREVLFYLGEHVEVDDADWTQVELLSMKNSRRLRVYEESLASPSTWTSARPTAAASAWNKTNATMVYPTLTPRSTGTTIPAQQADIAPAPRLYSPSRRQLQQIPRQTAALETRSSVEAATTEVTDDVEDVAGSRSETPQITTVDDFFRLEVSNTAANNGIGSGTHRTTSASFEIPVDATIDYGSDSDESTGEKSRNRSRKYTESDFMRDFEEEETLLQEDATSGNRAQRSCSSANRRQVGKPDNRVAVHVLLSADDAAVFDLAFGIDGLAATVDVKANEILETLHVPERESSIAFSRRLPDVVAIGTLTLAARAKIVVLRLRRADHLAHAAAGNFGSVRYQIETIASLVRLLAPLLGHLYAAASAHQPPITCMCSNCGGVSHLTPEYVAAAAARRHGAGGGDALVLHACLLCSSLNVREVASDRVVAMYASEGMALVGKRIKPARGRRAQVEVGFVLEEQELTAQELLEIHHCVLVSANGIREAVNAPLTIASS